MEKIMNANQEKKIVVNKYESWYMEQLNNIIENGQFRGDRTGVGVYSLPFVNYTHDLRESFPLMNGRFFQYKHPLTEIIWMMSGSSNIQYLIDNGCPFWNGFATPEDIKRVEPVIRSERIRMYAKTKGVTYEQAIAGFMHYPVTEADRVLDAAKIPNTVDVITKKYELGPVYGVMMRHWPNPDGTTFDQIQYALDTLRKDPNSRRVVVNCWNPSFLPDPKLKPHENVPNGKMSLTACHFSFGFYTNLITLTERIEIVKHLCGDGEWKFVNEFRHGPDRTEALVKLCDKYDVPKHYLDINFVMRSNDWVLGQPANANMYSGLLMMFAKELNMYPRFVNYTGWDVHVYSNHLDGVKELNRRWNENETPRNSTVKMMLAGNNDFYNHHSSEFKIVGDYKPLPSIKFPIAI